MLDSYFEMLFISSCSFKEIIIKTLLNIFKTFYNFSEFRIFKDLWGCWNRYIYLGSLRTCGGAGTDIYIWIFKDLWGTGTDYIFRIL